MIRNDELIKFEVYTHYLQGLASHLKKYYPNYSSLKPDKFSFSSKANRLDDVRKYLFNSWNTERLLNAPYELKSDGFFIKYANHWSPVLGYYSIFLCFQALFLAMGEDLVLEHRNFLNKISVLIKKKKLPFKQPWNLLCTGCCSCDQEEFNFKVNKSDIKSLNLLADPRYFDSAAFFGKLLCTTREKEEEYKIKRWKKEGKIKRKDGKPKKVYSKEETLLACKDLGATSLFNFLYRLRIRSNYEDADIFFLGGRDEDDTKKYFDSLLLVTDDTLFFVESLLLEVVGKSQFSLFIESFENYTKPYTSGILKRKNFH